MLSAILLDMLFIYFNSEGDGESVASSSVVDNEAPRLVGSHGGDATQQAEEDEARDKLR